MLELRPFAAVRYATERFRGDISPLIAPPYDVLDEADKRALLKKNERNIVAVDLPHLPPKSAGPPKLYEDAAARLTAWLADGTLIRETRPAIYLYHQLFTHLGRTYTRRMFIARLRLEAFERGVILPHEQTFGGPKEDRLALMKATRCQLSPIFGLYSDPRNRVGEVISANAQRSPDFWGTLDGVENRVWIVTDDAVIAGVARAMKEKKIYIADGHHRYGTALIYRDWMTKQNGRAGRLTEDHAGNFVMFVLASMDDPGCLILPYYRTLEDINLETLLRIWTDGIEVLEQRSGTADLSLHDGATGREVAVRFTGRELLRALEPGQVEAWYELDYAYLHRYLIDDLLTSFLKNGAGRRGQPVGKTKNTSAQLSDGTGHGPKVHYLKSADDAKRVAREHHGVALLVNATPMAYLRAVSEAGGLMPQKSTYFHPKLATGLTINPLS